MSRPIKVLMVVTGGLMKDGITAVWLNYIEAIRRNDNIYNNVRFDFVVMDNLALDEQVNRLKNLGCGVVKLPNRPQTPIRYFIKLIKTISENKYDVVHANGSSSLMVIEMLAAWLCGVKIRVAHSHNTMCIEATLHKLLQPLFLLFCNTRFACGSDAGKWLFGYRKFTVIPNGLEFEKYKYDESKRYEMRSKLGIEDKFVVGHVGKINEQKNHKYLLDIFSNLAEREKNAVLYIIGDGPLRAEIEEKVKKLGLQDKVVFTGEVNNVPDYLQAMDFMLLPSLYEGLPNVVIEWQAMGLPSIISDRVTKECGFTNLVNFMSIDVKPNVWCENFFSILGAQHNRMQDSIDSQAILAEKGYDINVNAIKIIQNYNVNK